MMRAALLALLLAAPAAAEAPAQTEAETAARLAWIDSFVERFRDEACGMHWAGNPVYPPCIAQLRWEAERAHAAIEPPPRFAPRGGP